MGGGREREAVMGMKREEDKDKRKWSERKVK